MNESIFSFTIGRIRKGMRREFEERAAAWDVTATQYQVLRRLWTGDEVGTLVLARDTGLDAGTITGVLDRLESKGLIQRIRSEEDRRAVRILLTESGRALEAPLRQIILDLNEKALKGLSTQQVDLLMSTLAVVQDNLQV